MRCWIKRLTFLAVFLMGMIVNVQAQITLETTFRPRSEFRNGYRNIISPAEEPAFFISQRSRIGLTYSGEEVDLGFSGQDARVWGQSGQLSNQPTFNIHEAWGRLRFNSQFSLKLGRQELIYDNQRLLGSVNWTQQGRSHDAAVIRYQDADENLTADAGFSFHQKNERLFGTPYPRKDNYKVLTYGWIQKKIDNVDLSALYLMDGFDTGASAKFRHTYGGRLTYQTGSLFLAGSYYRQNGSDLRRSNINAFMYSGQTGFSNDRFSLRAGYDHLSGGSKNGIPADRRVFNTLYATNHKFYGHMDYFLNIPADTRNGGLQDYYLRTRYTINSNLSLNLDYHHFALASTFNYPAGPDPVQGAQLGDELDLSATLKLFDEVTLQAGYSGFFTTETMEAIQGQKGNRLQQWGWIMLSINPTYTF